MAKANLGASIRAKLLGRGKEEGTEFTQILTRYALERILYRLSISDYRTQFYLKGALLFDLWFDVPHRPTRDADLLGFGSSDLEEVAEIFRTICEVKAEDGIIFDTSSVRVTEIRKEANYSGIRVTLTGELSGARCHVQVDVGFGDVVTPGPEEISYPLLVEGLPAPELLGYSKYTVIAEKFEAMVSLGMANSRMKDYFDIWTLARFSEFDGGLLQEAIQATFNRRGTDIPVKLPLALSDEFSGDSQKQTQWGAFLQKNAIDAVSLEEAVRELRGFLIPLTEVPVEGQPYSSIWTLGGPWGQAKDNA